MNKVIQSLVLVSMFLGCVPPSPKTETEKMNQDALFYQEIYTKIDTSKYAQRPKGKVTKVVSDASYLLKATEKKEQARAKAFAEVRSNILAEMAFTLSRDLNLHNMQMEDHYRKLLQKEIQNSLEKLMKLKVIKEHVNKKSYYIKASSSIDTNIFSRAFALGMRAKAYKSETIILDHLMKQEEQRTNLRTEKMIQLEKKLAAQWLLSQTVKRKLQKLKGSLKSALKEEENLQREYDETKKIVAKVMQGMKRKSEKACLVKVGMTKSKVLKAIGKPTTHNGSFVYGSRLYDAATTKWSYGTVTLEFSHSPIAILQAIDGCNKSKIKNPKKRENP